MEVIFQNILLIMRFLRPKFNQNKAASIMFRNCHCITSTKTSMHSENLFSCKLSCIWKCEKYFNKEIPQNIHQEKCYV